VVRSQTTPEVAEAIGSFNAEATKLAIDLHYGVTHMVAGDEAHDLFGPHASNYHVWMRKLKKALDPKGVSDSGQYISSK
jgi:FAD/FMN-containing dehydrogenase